MNEQIRNLTRDLSTRGPGEVEHLRSLAAAFGVELPADYLEFMGETDGADGSVGERYLDLWPVAAVLSTAASEPRYEDVLLFAGDGANTIFGFDAQRGGEIVEGDWIGLNRDELIRHGRSLAELLENLAAER
jgi:hypothetical protein